ncbi:uncharacterized protein LOC129583319 isoform X2 [Paramacrobiotus metropolitanus]|uniref:uncharacterized protein LOC129583319 isoform X2 n=1 Tax=Paramacrobiotus metropolitanus TaxID=2943436 RepID=UPI00244595F2|nr:uncharacterized protein LOC129583319 isoform X2 [Paramacrobiotus metropolitanus]
MSLMSTVSVVVCAVLLICSLVCVQGQFFTKTDKAVPRIGRRMDPQLVNNGQLLADIPISQDLHDQPFLYAKLASINDARRWDPDFPRE